MIILKHLTVERFRLLRELNLHFPQRGSILIQGPNEAGKSALLESIYFALYGEPLSDSRGHRPLDDLVLYGASHATVTLSLSVGATELTITRTIERGKGQKALLRVRRLGMPDEEPITRIDLANERIIHELGWLDGDTLRNSCLLEQKGLDRLEKLSGAEREKTARKILGMERLSHLSDRFQITTEDEALLNNARERLRLAEIQANIPVLSQRLEKVEVALDALRVCEDLAEIDQQEADITEQEQSIERIQTRRQELKARQARVQQLKKADSTLIEIISAYDGIAEARRDLPDLEKQIGELERREREELPSLEKRVNDLADLTRSFGTLQRMSNDLLMALDTIKELEQELKQHDEVKGDLKSLDDQVVHARDLLEEAQQALQDLEERRRAGMPQLEARLQRMKTVSERLSVLKQLEEHYRQRLDSKKSAADNRTQLTRVQQDLLESEHELSLVESEARQVQQQADALEKRWRKLGVRRQVEEWQRLKGLSFGLNEAEQHVRMAYQHKGKLDLAAMTARRSFRNYLLLSGVCAFVLLILVVFSFIILFQNPQIAWIAIILGVLALIAAGGGVWGFLNSKKSREEASLIEKQVMDADNRISMMVAAREAASRMGGSQDALYQVEREIQALGSQLPRSLEEAQAILLQTNDYGESLAELQREMKEKLDEANAARNQVNLTMEAVAALRKERTRLEDQYEKEDWAHLEENLRVDRAAVERLYQEITMLADQEELPRPQVSRMLETPSGFFSLPKRDEAETRALPDLQILVESKVKTTERELATLDGKLDLVTDLAGQVKIHQDALDVLLARKKVIEEREARYQTSNPALQIERAREQQAALRQALQALQDSLRQRVKPLGISFGQAAISNAESLARKQLEELQITLGNKIMLQERHADLSKHLKELQVALSEYYKQLAKYSNTLGSWIVPLNPFAEALGALRTRCQKELQDADETGIMHEQEALTVQEGASQVKIELCRQEIENAEGRISTMLAFRNRPAAKGYSRVDILAVWPLVGEYSLEDRPRLEDERQLLEDELTEQEEQEMALSTELQTGKVPLELDEARKLVEQRDRSYQTKKRACSLIDAAAERLLRKLLPRTEYYMQQILPLLTSGRYHDIRLAAETETGIVGGGPFKVSVWDAAANDYITKSRLSGGAADQLSLALRLAFAIACLPRELNAAPGFVLLDEPLSSFDRGRTRALVNVVTGEVLSQHFEQILLVSQSGAFDPALFPYHIYLDNGVVVESNLPVVPTQPPIASYGSNGNSGPLLMSSAQAVASE